MSRPLALTVAVLLQWVAAVVALISGFDLVAAAFEMNKTGVAQQIETALVDQGITDIEGELVVAGVFVAGVLLLVMAVVRVMVGVYLFRGRNWARIVVSILVAISLVGAAAYLFEGYVLRFALTAAVDVLILWLMFNSRSSAFIRERSGALSSRE